MELANQNRPQSFEEVIGQEVTVQILETSIRGGEVGGVYFFHGPAGTGKTTLARLIAKAINCERGFKDGLPLICNECNNCEAIKQGQSELLIEIDAATNRGINDIVALQDIVRRRPPQARHRVLIIDEVHGLTPQAFESLLKTLESPPPNNHFLLLTTEPFKVPKTVRSRGLQFYFKSVGNDNVRKVLKKYDISDSVKDLVVKKAKGNVRDVYMMIEQISSCSNLTENQTMQLLGVVGSMEVDKLVESFGSGWKEYIGEVDRLKTIYGVNVVCDLVKSILHDIALARLDVTLESSCGVDLIKIWERCSGLPFDGVKKALWELMNIYENSSNMEVALDLVPFFMMNGGSPVVSISTPKADEGSGFTHPLLKKDLKPPPDQYDSKLTGKLCSICSMPQFTSPSGVTCENGHGGAPSLGVPAEEVKTCIDYKSDPILLYIMKELDGEVI
jgi:DNA polymerase III subunit gamma/tau